MKHPFRFLLLLWAMLFVDAALAKELSQHAAVALAETFIVENGYTDAPADRIKPRLDGESIEWTNVRDEILKHRHRTLLAKAIGAKKGRRGDKAGWSIAFDYAPEVAGADDVCRVVTMDADGSNMRVEHVDGMRDYFAGF